MELSWWQRWELSHAPQDDADLALAYWSLQDLQRNHQSVFRSTSRARHFLQRCAWVILLGTGLTYATCSLLAESYYAFGMNGTGPAGDRIVALRHAANLFPLERRFRTASALLLGNLAIQQGSDEWKAAAVSELKMALDRDPTQADLLAMLIAFDLSLDRTAEAQTYYDQFKRVAKTSPLIDMVKANALPAL